MERVRPEDVKQAEHQNLSIIWWCWLGGGFAMYNVKFQKNGGGKWEGRGLKFIWGHHQSEGCTFYGWASFSNMGYPGGLDWLWMAKFMASCSLPPLMETLGREGVKKIAFSFYPKMSLLYCVWYIHILKIITIY